MVLHRIKSLKAIIKNALSARTANKLRRLMYKHVKMKNTLSTYSQNQVTLYTNNFQSVRSTGRYAFLEPKFFGDLYKMYNTTNSSTELLLICFAALFGPSGRSSGNLKRNFTFLICSRNHYFWHYKTLWGVLQAVLKDKLTGVS